MLLTRANASTVRVNSGPSDTIILSIKEVPKAWIAILVGNVMTIAAETSKNAHSTPEIVVPVSGEKKCKIN